MHTRHTAIALVLFVLACLGATSASAAAQPRIGSPKSLVARTWPFDPLFSGAQNCDAGICLYMSGAVHLLVGFNRTNHVTDIQTYDYPDPGAPRYWSMLLGFLPAGATRESCRTIRNTASRSGPVHACLYRWQRHRILVAQWLQENALERGGWVDLDMGYTWVRND